MENVDSDDCGPDGFEIDDSYNFYKLNDTVPVQASASAQGGGRSRRQQGTATCLTCLLETECFFMGHQNDKGDAALGEGPCSACKSLKAECKAQCPDATTSAQCAVVIQGNDGAGDDGDSGASRTFPVQFVVCTVGERVDGNVWMAEVGKATCEADDDDNNPWVVGANPPIDFVTVHEESTQVYSSGAATLVPIATTDAVIMAETPAGCTGNKQIWKSFIGLQSGSTGTDTSETTFYQYDRRLSLVSNTLDAPASVDSDAKVNSNFGGSMRDEVCPVVPRTFLNEESCVQQSGSICGSKSFERNATFVTLDSQTFADWFANDQKHVHAIRGLRLQKYEDGNAQTTPTKSWIPPCHPGATTRWIRTKASDGCPSTAPWNSATAGTIAAALVDGSKTADVTNAVVRDVVVRELKFELVKEKSECKNADSIRLSTSTESVAECADLCTNYAKGGCEYFAYGKPGVYTAGYCYMEDLEGNGPCAGADDYKDTNYYDLYKLDIPYATDVAGTCNVAPADDFVGATVEVNVDTGIDNGTGTGTTTVNVECWKHSHPDEYNVYDFSRWAGMHPGNEDAIDGGRRNPITRFAEESLAELWLPSWHAMSRWNRRSSWYELQANIVSIFNSEFNFYKNSESTDVKFGDAVDIADLNPNLQTLGVSASVGATYEYLDQELGFEACGSRGEVANEPALGNKFYNVNQDFGFQGIDQEQYRYEAGKGMVWSTVVMNAQDQLRQRTAWALSQTFTIGTSQRTFMDDETETWLTYYDIFVSNAFGNFRDIVREVSYSPLMGEYLTYKGNAAFAANGGKFPDENFAREVMQLFTIGLWELNIDGTFKTNPETGGLVPTYSSANIREFAKVWTGFGHQDPRSNIEIIEEDQNENVIDPMKLMPLLRDRFPKTVLGDNGDHIGDTYPLCSELPPQHFLQKGAKYRLHGSTSMYGKEVDDEIKSGVARKHFAPDQQSSQLYAALCSSSSSSNKCTFPSAVVLEQDIACDGAGECLAETLHAVQIVDIVTGATGFYTYVEPPCVHLQFFDGKVAKFGAVQTCANPNLASTIGARCCKPYDTTDYCPLTHPVFESHAGDPDYGDVCRNKNGDRACPPGCMRTATEWSAPHCLVAPDVANSAETTIELSGANDNDAQNLKACTGECDSDAQCAAGLQCFQRSYGEAIPGCSGPGGGDDWDYCTSMPTEACQKTEPGGVISEGNDECLFVADTMKYATAEARCAAEYEGGIVCPRGEVNRVEDEEEDSNMAWQTTCSKYQYSWTKELCSLQVQVYPSGQVGVVDIKAAYHVEYLEPSSGNTFQVQWENTTADTLFPLHWHGCAAGCVSVDKGSSSCICDAVVVNEAVVVIDDGGATLPSEAELRAELKVGAFSPEAYDTAADEDNRYMPCTSAFCTSQPAIKVYVRGSANVGETTTLGMDAIFEFVNTPDTPQPSPRKQAKYLLNRRSFVEIGTPEYEYFTIQPATIPVIGCTSSSYGDYDCLDVLNDNSDKHYTNETKIVGAVLLEAEFDSLATIDRIGFSHISEERNQPKQVLFQFSDGTSHSATLSKEQALNTVVLPNPVETSSVKVIVESVYGAPCIFPFIYKDIAYNECTTVDKSYYWCATELNEDGVKTGYSRECSQGLRALRFYPPGAADRSSTAPCVDAGFMEISGPNECQEAAPHVTPEGYAIDSSRFGISEIDSWTYKPVGCSVDAGEIEGVDSRHNGDWEPAWNIRAMHKEEWTGTYWPVCKRPSAAQQGGGNHFRFRNPPHFVANTGETTWMPGTNYWDRSTQTVIPFGGGRDGVHLLASAEHETEALLDHIVEHANTPPFIAHKLIQRLVASNPSPRYVKVVASAFIEGAYGGKIYSGKYGDMEATITAILMDRDARTPILDMDPAHGQLREPLLKVMHLMRAMEFESKDGREVALEWMEDKLGQMAFESPSVFSFFLPEFAPDGPVAQAGLVAPEAQLATAPYLVGYLNGVSSLLDNGLSYCGGGFGGDRRGLSCYRKELVKNYSEGTLQFAPKAPSNPSKVIDELALLLTGGRMSMQTRTVLLTTYTDIVAESPFDMSAAVAKLKSAVLSEEECMAGIKAQLNVPIPIPVQSCSASSTSDEEDHNCTMTYVDYDTRWEAGNSDAGAWLFYTFAQQQTVGKLAISLRCYTRQAKPKQVLLQFSDGEEARFELTEEQASNTRAFITLDTPVTTQSVKITFETNYETAACIFPFVYEGVTYNSCTDVRKAGEFRCATDVNPDTLVQEDYGICAAEDSTNIVATLHVRELQIYEPGDVPINVLDNEDDDDLYMRNYDSKPAGCVLKDLGTDEPPYYAAYYNEHLVGCGHPFCGKSTIVSGGNADDYIWVAPSDTMAISNGGWGGVDGVINTVDSDEIIHGASNTNSPQSLALYMGKPEGLEINSVTLYLPFDYGADDNNGLSVYIDNTLCASNVGPFDEGDVFRVPCKGVGTTVRIDVPGGEGKRMRFTEIQINLRQKPDLITGSYLVNANAESFALKQTLKVLTLGAPEWHTTNQNGATLRPRAPPEVQESLNRTFKAVVVVFLAGGADSYNMVVPHSQCTKKPDAAGGGSADDDVVPFDYYEEYASIRGNDPENYMALRHNQLLPIELGNATTHQTPLTPQPCKTFGLHPDLKYLKTLFDERELAVLANVGPLVVPATMDDWNNRARAGAKPFPVGVGGHNTMQKDTMTVHSKYRDAKGVLGRIAKVLTADEGEATAENAKGLKGQLYSLDGYAPMLDGSKLVPTIIGSDGLQRFHHYADVADELKELAEFEIESLYGETITQSLQEALYSTELLGEFLENTTLKSGRTFPDSSLSRQLLEVSKVIQLNKETFSMERSAFYTATGGFDTHATVDISGLMTDLNDALEVFTKEMKGQGLWNDVTVVVASEFGRTLSSNAQGADHGWGGNYFVLGGDVNGKQMLGKYPSRLAEFESELNLRRGIFLPTTPWEAVWSPIAQWLGVKDEQLDEILPNMKNFPSETIFSKEQLFGDST